MTLAVGLLAGWLSNMCRKAVLTYQSVCPLSFSNNQQAIYQNIIFKSIQNSLGVLISSLYFGKTERCWAPPDGYPLSVCSSNMLSWELTKRVWHEYRQFQLWTERVRTNTSLWEWRPVNGAWCLFLSEGQGVHSSKTTLTAYQCSASLGFSLSHCRHQ